MVFFLFIHNWDGVQSKKINAKINELKAALKFSN